jgi:hypothetical protein
MFAHMLYPCKLCANNGYLLLFNVYVLKGKIVQGCIIPKI